jgi:hypothetical protein
LPPIPSNTRPPANRPVTVQPSSNTPPIPSSAPRPSSVNSPAPARPTPPPFEKKNILPVANVDQDVKEEPAQLEETKPAVVEEEEEEKKIEPVVEEEEEEEEEAFVHPQPEPKKEQDVIKEDAPQEVLPEPITEEPVVEQAPVEEETKVEETEKEQEIPSVEPTEKEEEEEKKVETPIEEKEEEQVKEEENKVEEPSAQDEPSADDDKAEEPSAQEEPKEEEPSGLSTIPTSGPKLTTPSRARIGGNRARRNVTPTSEPSQTEVLQKELEQMPELEKKAAPPKPVKPIFAKFPTPFASGEEITKHQLKPVTRRPWEVKQQEQQEAAAAAASTTETKDEEPVRPTGVKNLASRFNFAGNSGGGGNEVLETKLKNHTKNEVEKVRKEFEHLLQEEREKRDQLEDRVAVLMERLEALENK